MLASSSLALLGIAILLGARYSSREARARLHRHERARKSTQASFHASALFFFHFMLMTLEYAMKLPSTVLMQGSQYGTPIRA